MARIDREYFDGDGSLKDQLKGKSRRRRQGAAGLRAPERQALMDAWYRPHHEALALATDRFLRHYGRALLIDAHSFPKLPLPYEVNQCRDRPEICIGTDEFHTPKALESCVVNAFKDAGFTVRLNS
jgi:N-formylglutamate deformylase